jgi:hypothetical protein
MIAATDPSSGTSVHPNMPVTILATAYWLSLGGVAGVAA